MNNQKIKGNIVDVINKRIFEGILHINEDKISQVELLNEEPNTELPFILPGFVDSHVHIESSMLVPSEFAKMAVVHGTVATISDPHEIANVCGLKGVEYMIDNGKKVNFKFNFGAPSCVPATHFETAGATINSEDIKNLLQRDEIKYLSEMMNFPGVLFKDAEVLKKIEYALQANKPIDGHAPGLRGEQCRAYCFASNNFTNETKKIIISTDHECFTKEEAIDKLACGMKILIREGSAAKNFDELINLLQDNEDMMMFCSDDKHPDSLEINHINVLCQRAVSKGIDIFKVLKASSINTIKHYNLDVGTLQIGDYADFIIVEDLKNFNVLTTYINGTIVANNGKSLIKSVDAQIINEFNCSAISIADIEILNTEYTKPTVPVIEALEGQLITNRVDVDLNQLLIKNTNILSSNTGIDVLKIVVVNRYNNAPIAKAFIKNFGFKKGAIASTVAHDSHNIVAVGVDDKSLVQAINAIIDCKGGISVSYDNDIEVLPLPVAGLMTTEDGYLVSKKYTHIDILTKKVLGSTLQSPFMTLSFMALLVIPNIKLSDKGLFDGNKFEFVVY